MHNKSAWESTISFNRFLTQWQCQIYKMCVCYSIQYSTEASGQQCEIIFKSYYQRVRYFTVQKMHMQIFSFRDYIFLTEITFLTLFYQTQNHLTLKNCSNHKNVLYTKNTITIYRIMLLFSLLSFVFTVKSVEVLKLNLRW